MHTSATKQVSPIRSSKKKVSVWIYGMIYEGWNFNSGNYLFTTDTK